MTCLEIHGSARFQSVLANSPSAFGISVGTCFGAADACDIMQSSLDWKPMRIAKESNTAVHENLAVRIKLNVEERNDK